MDLLETSEEVSLVELADVYKVPLGSISHYTSYILITKTYLVILYDLPFPFRLAAHLVLLPILCYNPLSWSKMNVDGRVSIGLSDCEATLVSRAKQ